MNITKATQRYERWLGRQIPLLAADLDLKHKEMASAASAFPFFRATFYRWIQRWPDVCPELASAPTVLAVGDLHVENFGTWRDIEGRLIWGVNDFDEAYPLPYTNDLVRLAASAHMAIAENRLVIEHKDACSAILTGYTECHQAGGRAFVLAEHHPWLREMAISHLRDPKHYWEKLDALKSLNTVPGSAAKALERLMPEPGLAYRVAHRIAGLGSLGRERFVALADWRGGKVAREAKALAHSACCWAHNGRGADRIRYEDILDQAVRCRDPFVRLKGRWIVRRLAPDCSRIELTLLPKVRDESKLLHAMGWETANVHLGTKKAAGAIKKDLRKRGAEWLHAAAKEMVKVTEKEWEEWKSRG